MELPSAAGASRHYRRVERLGSSIPDSPHEAYRDVSDAGYAVCGIPTDLPVQDSDGTAHRESSGAGSWPALSRSRT